MSLALAEGAPTDFDFIIGNWRVKHKRLNERLANCIEWTEFEGLSSTTRILGGFGNIEDNILHFPDGLVRAVAMRSYCPNACTWSIWWLDGRNPTQLDVPVVGKFEKCVGTFYADDIFDGQPIKVRFQWTAMLGQPPLWAQAFSKDAGATWETNWEMEFLPM